MILNFLHSLGLPLKGHAGESSSIEKGTSIKAQSRHLRQTNTNKTNKGELSSLFSTPLILGASVSASYSTLGPGQRAALRFTSSKQILTLAQGGTPGRDMIAKIEEDLLSSRSLVVAIDLFFWDSTLSSARQSVRHMERFLAQARKLNVPVILGDIPELLPGLQPGRSELNKKIRELCQEENNCLVLELDQLHKQVLRDRHLTIKGQRLTLKQLVPDGLHLAETASEYLADQIVELASSGFKDS